ncbi:MAG: ATP-binding protein [Candidatus Omnitrophica bacterium]|nr:ATP-binding protein [Candidatus Omnitrophota bacterium]
MTHNRLEILNNLIHRLNSFCEGYRQNIAIIGEPYIGKTSLIKELLASDKIKKDDMIPIYLETKIEPFDFCVKRFIKSALFNLLRSDPSLTTPPDTVLLIEDLKRTYPKTAQTCAKVLQDVEKSRLEEAYSAMLDIPATIHEESKKRCVLIMDEFHNLDNFPLKHPFATLAKKIIIQKDTMYILMSSKSTLSQRLLSEKLSLLFGNFEKIILPPLDINSSRIFLQENITGANIPHAYLDFIISFTGGMPFYMKVVCDEIERAVFSKKLSPDDFYALIEYALAEVIFKKTGTLNQLFSNMLLKFSDGRLLSKSTSVLISLSSENKKQQDIIKSSRLQARDVSRILSRLVETDVLARNGSFYRFKDRLFCFWLQSVYLKKILSFSIDDTLEEDCFKSDIKNRLNAFLKEFEKGLYSRVTELFRLFKNDVIQLNGKKHKFMAFDNVREAENSALDNTGILAANGKTRWSCVIKKERVTESNASDIVKNAKSASRKDRVNRNIIVCLEGIDENAYLIAKEAKFWVWNTQDLNVLMELYGKPHIS